MRLFLLAAVILCAGWLSGPASAHAILLSSTSDGHDVILHYNGRIDVARSRVVLLQPNGAAPKKLDSGAGDDPASLTVHLGDLPAGSYVLRWEVLSVDGHISRGDQPVTLPTP